MTTLQRASATAKFSVRRLIDSAAVRFSLWWNRLLPEKFRQETKIIEAA